MLSPGNDTNATHRSASRIIAGERWHAELDSSGPRVLHCTCAALCSPCQQELIIDRDFSSNYTATASFYRADRGTDGRQLISRSTFRFIDRNFLSVFNYCTANEIIARERDGVTLDGLSSSFSSAPFFYSHSGNKFPPPVEYTSEADSNSSGQLA